MVLAGLRDSKRILVSIEDEMTEQTKTPEEDAAQIIRPDQMIGEFPFPITERKEESRYLNWLRNHSNYMVENGFTDYLRIIAVLVRGIFLNFLILLPYFMIIGALMSLLHLTLSEPQSVEFDFEQKQVAPGSRVGTIGEELTITVVSNFWKTDSLTFDFDRTSDGIIQSLEFLLLDLSDSSINDDSQFSEIAWNLDEDWLVATVISSGEMIEVDRRELQLGDVQRDFRVRAPLLFSSLLLAAAGVIVIAYPIVIRMSRVRRYKKALRTGHFSSVKRRDLYERLFGGLLLFMILVAFFETFPLLTALFHSVRQGDVAVAVPTIASMVGLIVGANQVLPRLGGWVKSLGIFLVGILGIAIPLLVILFVVEFLVYTDKQALLANEWFWYVRPALMVLPSIFAFLLFMSWVIGLRSFRLRGHLQLIALFSLMILIVFGVREGAEYIETNWSTYLFTYYIVIAALEISLYCWLAVDVNQTSINSLYRDRLASAYLIGVDTEGDIDIEQDINLQEICNYDAGSSAPYHLINVALNLQATKDPDIRDRNSDFFIFSKRFIGGGRTGYCRSENMEAVFAQMDLGTAMAISAAAASPNMGRAGSSMMAAFLTLLNIRLGFWVPHPDRLEKYLARKKYTESDDEMMRFDDHVFLGEIPEIAKRRYQAYHPGEPRPMADMIKPTVAHNMVGLAFSGGGIRSATINLGIVQELHRRGVFQHVDYMSTVSGGGYLGSSISTLMRHKVAPYAEFDGKVRISQDRPKTVTVESGGTEMRRQEHGFAPFARFAPELEDGMQVQAGQMLLDRTGPAGRDRFVSLMDSFSWRVRPNALRREMFSKLDETTDWINLSDGGHIENLAGMELLRRRCKIIIIGDGEADPNMAFNGLATLIRFARLDLGVNIDIDITPIKLRSKNQTSKQHFAIGRITYPAVEEYGIDTPETGYLVYLKSSMTGDEDAVIEEYQSRNPTFPHESTADQLFDEGQFEAYRALGEHIARSTLPKVGSGVNKLMSYDNLERWVAGRKFPETSSENVGT